MENFNFSLPTNVLFGKGQINNLPGALKQFGKKVLLTYGGGSIKRTGLYDEVMALLKDFEVFELSDIEPNPSIETVESGVRICREKGIDVVLAVGGGSTIDCSKAIAAGTFYEGNLWNMILESPSRGTVSMVKKALPVCTILTLAATGSETNGTGVISNNAEKIKVGFASPLVVPKYSVMDPQYTFTVPKNQTAAGTADILSHVLEVYFCNQSAYITDGICEAVMRSAIKYGPVALEEPTNYEARANLMWAGSLAINGICAKGNTLGPWSCHSMEHELSAYYNITHGLGLAIVTPRWMRHILNEKTASRFANYGVNVWGIDSKLDTMTIALKAIEKTEAFFDSLGLEKTLTALGIGEENFRAMAEHCVTAGKLETAYAPLTVEDVIEIFKNCL